MAYIQNASNRFTLIDHPDPLCGKMVVVDWTLGNSCSYACSYCPKNLHDGSLKWQKPNDVLHLYRQLRRHYVDEMDRIVWLQLTGGEPTMHPQIVDLLHQASAKGFKISLISNASRTVRFWEKINKCLNSVILTYHAEFADLDHFIRVAGMMVDHITVHINVTMHPDHFDQTLEDARKLRAALPAASISLKPLRRDFGAQLYDYTKEQMQVLTNGLPSDRAPIGEQPRSLMRATTRSGRTETLRPNEFLLRDLNRWRGYKCNVGLESLRIRGNGEVYRGVCCVGGRLGYLGEDLVLPRDPIRCTKDACSCLADILIRKER
ncbi:molybdenum cofactor biosynthesis protein A [Ruegeria denitrificans]|uniref:Molybdenum cofactor biosynthesis protein A n=1 Tax=Ruegeria denitrificans TaxID=1715692 RepID=A0A0P1IGJ6_9RHOB|nr:radical SAM protein [Ruegeria denitrificans]CUJ93240.1 molybdenum cofactor biosynthesis protein A [Ruegeria denitrificans]